LTGDLQTDVTPGGRGTRVSRPKRRRSPVSWTVGVLALVPLLLLVLDAGIGRLGVEPVEAVIRRTGWWALALLLATLAITPARRLTGLNVLIQARRPLGLSAFGYAALHFLLYTGLDQWFGFGYILEDILERPFITAGFLAFILLIPLAATSTSGAIRRLGGRRWRRLHMIVYPATVLAVLHYFWLVKADTRGPLLFAGVLAILFALRTPLAGYRARHRTATSVGRGGAADDASE